MRYGIAFVTAALLSAAVIAFARETRRQIEEQIRQNLARQGVDVAPMNTTGFIVKLPARQQWRMDLTRSVTALWYVWVPVVIALSLVLADLVD